MSCICCEVFAKRITNIYKDEDLKLKFESLTGLVIFNNLFLCEECELILLSSYNFKEKCTENYEKDLIKYDPIEKSNSIQKTETSNTYLLFTTTKDQGENTTEDDSPHIFSIETKDNHQLSLAEEHLIELDEDNIQNITIDSLNQTHNKSPRLRLQYTLKEKLKAIEIAEQSSNRQAAKKLSIDESCIRKWRQKKHQMKINENQNACKLRKTKSIDTKTLTVPDINSFEVIECELQTTEIVDEMMEKEQGNEAKVKELKTRRAYSSSEKLEVVAFAEITGNRQAAKVFKIDESCIRKWRNQKDLLIEINRERGTKRKPNLRFPQLESLLKSFVMQKLDEGIMLKPSEIKAESLKIANDLKIPNFKGTSSYIFKFMERYHIPSGKSKKTQAQKKHEENVQ